MIVKFFCFSPWCFIVFACFSNTCQSGWYVCLACSIILLCFGGAFFIYKLFIFVNITRKEDKAETLIASLWTSYWIFSILILSSIVLIIFQNCSVRFFLKCKTSDTKVVSLTKKEYFFFIHSVVSIFNVNIWWVFHNNLLKFTFSWNFYNKIMFSVLSHIFCNNHVWLRVKIREILIFDLY